MFSHVGNELKGFRQCHLTERESEREREKEKKRKRKRKREREREGEGKRHTKREKERDREEKIWSWKITNHLSIVIHTSLEKGPLLSKSSTR